MILIISMSQLREKIFNTFESHYARTYVAG